MHTLKSEYKIPADAKTVFTTMRDDYKGYWKDLPNIEKFKVLEDKKISAKKKRVVIEWTGRAPIPKILQHLLSPKMLKWVDTGIWNEEDRTLEWDSKTYYYSDLFTSRGKWHIKPDGKHKDASVVVLDGFVEIRMPIFGGIAEKIIAHHLMQNLKKAEKNLKELLEK